MRDNPLPAIHGRVCYHPCESVCNRAHLDSAGRCLSCGSCFECDGCLGACPEDAVIKLGVGHRYWFDYDRCTGCGECYEQCPVHAIEMVAEGE